MVNTVTSQTLLDDNRFLNVKINVVGDGSGEETNTVAIDASAFNTSDIKITQLHSSLTGFSVKLLWDATANVDACSIAEGEQDQDFRSFGGLINNAGAGKTGDILFTTTGLGAGDEGHFILRLRKKNAV